MSEAAGWLAEAWMTGAPLAPLPDLADPEAVAAALVEALGVPVAGIRLARGPGGTMLAGPLLAPRLLRAGTPVALATLRHARISAGVLGILAAPLDEGPPEFASLHPVLDLADSRFTTVPTDPAQITADMAGLGLVVLGKRSVAPLPAQAEVRLGLTGERPRPIQEQLGALMAEVAAAARRWGGLPAGAALMVSGLGGEARPETGQRWAAAIAGIGRINLSLD